MVKSKKTPTKTIVKKTKPVVAKPEPKPVYTAEVKLLEAKEIIAKLCLLYPNDTGKTWDRAKNFINS